MERRADLILANRAYMDHDTPLAAEARTPAGNGGLLAAVRPVIAPWDGREGTTWIGAGRGQFDGEWCDSAGVEIIPTSHGDLRHRRLFFDDTTWREHYAAASNSFLWPLLHLVREPLPDRTDYYPAPAVPSDAEWRGYVTVNRAFAVAALDEERPQRTCWIHDYQLALVPSMLRLGGFAGRIGFFLHTPFPSLDVAAPYLDARATAFLHEFVAGILGAGVVGVQSAGDVERFKSAAERLCGARATRSGVVVAGRCVRVEVCPVGIDVDELSAVAGSAPRSRRLASIPRDLPIVVGLERDDYTKGIPERLNAVAEAYRRGSRFAYVGIAAPTREGVPAYDRLARAIAQASDAAAAAAAHRNLPYSHAREAIEWSEVIALQRDAAVVFTSSLADGLNLVPLQAAFAQRGQLSERAVLITGRDAGVASAYAGFGEDGLVTVDPLNPEDMATTLQEALAGRPGRVSDRLIDQVRRNDARAWAMHFLSALEESC